MSERLALEAYLGRRGIPFTRAPDGTVCVPLALGPEIAAICELRWVPGRRLIECATMLPLPVGPENRSGVRAALSAINATLRGSTFVVTDGAIAHLASVELGVDGALAPGAVERALERTQGAWDTHSPALVGAVSGGVAAVDGPDALGDTHLAELRREIGVHRPIFLERLDRPILIEDVGNPWFRQHRILFVQSPSPMPAIGITVCLAPSGRYRVLAGQPTALNEVARAERIALTDDEDARAYANLVTSWTRAADFPEMPVESFDEIPFRPALSEADRSRIQRLRAEVIGRMAPLSFVRAGDGWRLDVWLVSVSRLIHRIADLRADGTLDVRDDIVATELPVPPGRVWGMVDGRLVPVG